jgi:hypothetical protein
MKTFTIQTAEAWIQTSTKIQWPARLSNSLVHLFLMVLIHCCDRALEHGVLLLISFHFILYCELQRAMYIDYGMIQRVIVIIMTGTSISSDSL